MHFYQGRSDFEPHGALNCSIGAFTATNSFDFYNSRNTDHVSTIRKEKSLPVHSTIRCVLVTFFKLYMQSSGRCLLLLPSLWVRDDISCSAILWQCWYPITPVTVNEDGFKKKINLFSQQRCFKIRIVIWLIINWVKLTMSFWPHLYFRLMNKNVSYCSFQ